MMFRPESLGDHPSVFQLVIVGLAKADGESLQRRIGEPRRRGHNRTRIYPAAEKRAQGNVAHHVQANRLFEKPAHMLDKVVFFFPVIRLETQLPVALNHRDRKSTRLNSSHLGISYA